MTLSASQVYIFLSIVFFAVWLVLLFLQRKNAKKILWPSAVAILLTPLAEVLYFFNDYWHPESVLSGAVGGVPLRIEDILFGVATTGIPAVLYATLFRVPPPEKKYTSRKRFALVLTTFVLFMNVTYILGVPSILGFEGALLCSLLLILWYRKELAYEALGNGVLFLLLVCGVYTFTALFVGDVEQTLQSLWFLYGTPLDIRFWGIPLTELLWALMFGASVSPWYEFSRGLLVKSETAPPSALL